MASIFSSHRALEVLAALEQRGDGMRLAEVALAIDAPVSSAQVALALLVDDGLVATGVAGRPVYRLASGQEGDVAKLLDVATGRVADERLLRAAIRANPAVEFAGQDGGGLLVVTRWYAEPRDEVQLDRMLARTQLQVQRASHDEVRQLLLGETGLRERAHRSRPIIGSVERSFPDPFRHGAPDAPLLGRLHPTVPRPSRAALARVARRFGLEEIRVFGSAVRADLRPDSDIDVMVRRRRGTRRSMADESALRRQLEDLLGRDVDVVDADLLRPEVRRKAESEGIVLDG